LDHQEYLGETEEAIAFEKGGIIKSFAPVVIGRMGREAEQVLRRIARDRSAPLWQLGRDFAIDDNRLDRRTYRGVTRVFSDLTCGLAGRHQWDNAACALALLEAAGTAGIDTDEGAVRTGLRTVSWEGRLESIDEYPKIVLDGAHNPAAAHALAGYLEDFSTTHPASRIILVWGMMRDKDQRRFIAPLLPFVSEIVLTQAILARSATIQQLRATLHDWHGSVLEAVLPMDALAAAKSRARPHDLICIAGSLMLLGDIKAAMRGCGLSPIRG
jgi:dihydrofolate synthase/folylpolyglutamate synthase